MLTVKKKQKENAVQAATSLLASADYIHHTSLAVAEVSSIVKANFPPTKVRREIVQILNTISHSSELNYQEVKSRVTRCAPKTLTAYMLERNSIVSLDQQN